MKTHYVDPSAWVKRHFEEAGTEAVNRLFRGPISAACCGLGLLEMVATVARKAAQASIGPDVTTQVIGNIRNDHAAFRIVRIDEPLIELACELARKHRLRSMDALHLAAALSLGAPTGVVMVSADAELLASAAAEGLATFNPAVAIS
jgi:predicted nucleic acid-binding protein